MKTLLIAAGMALGLAGMTAPAVAQPKQDHRGMRHDDRMDHRDHDRDRRDHRRDDRHDWRHDNGRHNGWRNHHGWRGNHYGQRCRIVYRHHHRERVCY